MDATDLWGIATVVAVSGTAIGVLIKYILRPTFLVIIRTNDFLDDWFGVPERDGQPARAGVMSRLREVEITKVERTELADLVAVIAQKADRAEVLALREALDSHIKRMDAVHPDSGVV